MKKRLRFILFSFVMLSLGYYSATFRVAPPVQAFAQNLDRGFADLVKKVEPGVVNISTFARPKIQNRMQYGDENFRRFFEEFFGGGMPRPEPRPEEEDPHAPRAGKPQPVALGTGFVIDEAGLILTNFHVIGNAEEVKVQFNEEDEELVPAEIIGKDPELDVALLQVKTKKKLVAIPLGDSDKIDKGEYILAIGNPLGYGHTVSHGILSSKGRKSPEFKLGRFLQTDASINPGNSGGPMINMRGEVVGINNAIDARGQGIGFAIPINLVKNVLGQLKTKGSVSRGFLGVSVGDLNPEMAQQLKLPAALKGVVIADVSSGSPAEKAGLRPYDVITQVNSDKVTSGQELTEKITAIPVGGIAQVTYIRGTKEMTAKVTVAERPVDGMALERTPRSHPHGNPLARSKTPVTEEFGFKVESAKSEKALKVIEVIPGKAAEMVGLQRGDLILDAAGKSVTRPEELEAALKLVKDKSIMLRVKRYDAQGDAGVNLILLSK